MADWSNLLSDLLQTIADRLLGDVADYVRLRAVCSSWRSAAADYRSRCSVLPPQLPWFLVDVDWSAGLLSFSSLSDSKSIRRSVLLPSACLQGRLKFSTDGWLVFADSFSLVLRLFNPLTGDLVRLPSLSALPVAAEIRRLLDSDDGYTYLHGRRMTEPDQSSLHWIRGVAFSSSPNSAEGCTVVANLMTRPQRTLVALRVGGEEDWFVADQDWDYDDVIFHEGSFYAVDILRRIAVFNLDLEKTVVSSLEVTRRSLSRWRLAEASGELWLLRRNFADVLTPYKGGGGGGEESVQTYKAESLDVYRLDSKGDEWSAVEVKDLRNQVFFLDAGRASSLSTVDYQNQVYAAPQNFTIEKVIRVGECAVFRANRGSLEVQADCSACEFCLRYGLTTVWHLPRLS